MQRVVMMVFYVIVIFVFKIIFFLEFVTYNIIKKRSDARFYDLTGFSRFDLSGEKYRFFLSNGISI